MPQKKKPYKKYYKKQTAKKSRSVNPEINNIVKDIGSSIGSLAGSFIPIIGSPIGSSLGRTAGDVGHRLFKLITGYGDYHLINVDEIRNNRDYLFGKYGYGYAYDPTNKCLIPIEPNGLIENSECISVNDKAKQDKDHQEYYKNHEKRKMKNYYSKKFKD
jgi:hypothetical protein